MIVKINDREIKLKWSFRCLMMFENIMKKSFAPENTTDVLVFMYCVLITSEKDFELKFDDFLDYIDANPGLIVEFGDWFTNEMDRANSVSPDSDEEEIEGEENSDKKKLKK